MTQTINLKISGMSCGGCSAAVENALRSAAGVKSVMVNFQAGTAKVDLSEENVDISQLIVAVKMAGYDARIM